MKAIVLLAAAAAASGAEIKPFDVKTGLWETTSSTEVSGAPPMPQIPPDKLAQLPPEQRARIEALMKGRNAQSTTSKTCITKDTLSRALTFRDDDTCKSTLVSSSASKQEIHLECTRDAAQSTGDITLEKVDAEHAKGNGVIKSTMQGGRSMGIKINFDTKWISSDCGDVKPMGEK